MGVAIVRDFRVRCPIHGFISLEPEELALIDLPIFQRLRRIKQLAFTDLVYPGATHSRFDHSLGVCHLAGEVGDHLKDLRKISAYEVRRLRLAGLLHDIGHPPFSHVGEEALKLFADEQAVEEKQGAGGRYQIHEIITGHLLLHLPGLKKAISDHKRKELFDLLLNWDGEPLQKSVISGPLDVDKQDYLLRDSYFCGVKYGVFDNHQLLREIRPINGTPPGSTPLMLGISEDGVHSLEQFVLAKFYISTQVYTHKVRLISDQMLLRAIRLGIETDDIRELKDIFVYNGSSEFIENYIKWNDHNFISFFSCDKFTKTNCEKLLRALLNRQLFKRIFHTNLNIPEIEVSAKKELRSINEAKKVAHRSSIEQNIYEALKEEANIELRADFDDPHFIILNCYQTKDLREQAGDTEGEIVVESSDGPRTFNDISQLFQSMRTGFNETFIDVYAPIVYTADNKQQIVDRMRKPILKVLANSFANGESYA